LLVSVKVCAVIYLARSLIYVAVVVVEFPTVALVVVNVVDVVGVVVDIVAEKDDLVGVKLLIVLVFNLLDHLADLGLLIHLDLGHSILEASVSVPVNALAFIDSIVILVVGHIHLIIFIKVVVLNVELI